MPVLRRQHDDGEVLPSSSAKDHDAIEKLVILVERAQGQLPDVPDLVNDLSEITERHTHHADEHLLPFLRSRLSEAELASWVERCDRGTATSRLTRIRTCPTPAPSPGSPEKRPR